MHRLKESKKRYKMHRITRADRLAMVAKNWRFQAMAKDMLTGDTLTKYGKLAALKYPSPLKPLPPSKLLPQLDRVEKQVKELIKNDTWTTLFCHECQEICTRAVVIGTIKSTLIICDDCIEEASLIIKAEPIPESGAKFSRHITAEHEAAKNDNPSPMSAVK